VSTIEATPPAGRPLAAEPAGYVQQQLVDAIRDLLERVKGDDTLERLAMLALDVEDELDRRDVDRQALHHTAITLAEHVRAMSRDAELLLRLAATVALGWADHN
jgi:hypothetical protein